MGRYENENVEHIDNSPDQQNTYYFLEDGIKVTKEQYYQAQCQEIVCAKIIENTILDRNYDEFSKTNYYVLANNRGQLFDPRESDSRYRIRTRWQYRKVRRSVFDTYLKFLQQKYKSFLIQAEREL
jgi:hypothetical protein